MNNKIVRKGKTEKDHKSGAHARNRSNKATRAAWQSPSNKDAFPYTTCNGKKNRHRYMGACAVYVIKGEK